MKKREAQNPLKDIRSSRGHELDGRKLVLCVTGSVASIEVPGLARELMRHGADVHVVMSEAAEKLVRPDALQWATGNPVVRKLTGETEHVWLAGEWEGRAHMVVIAPCTANTVSKVALGIDDTPVTTVASMAMGSGIPLMICPAAHEPMYRNPSVQVNISSLEAKGVVFVGPKYEEGKAKMASVDEIVSAVIRQQTKQDFRGKKVLVSGGPTVEFIDPVRVITNLSSGKMGLSLAKEAWRRGADVSYVYGGNLRPPAEIKSIRIETTSEMRKTVMAELAKGRYDVFISAAAPADFTPVHPARTKIPTRDGELKISVKPTPKIVEGVKKAWPKLYVAAFKAETTNSKRELTNAMKNLRERVGVDMVVGNMVGGSRGFGADSNSVLILGKRAIKGTGELPKHEVAQAILDEIAADMKRSSRL